MLFFLFIITSLGISIQNIDHQIQLMDLLMTGLENSFIRQDYEYIQGQLLEFANRKEVTRNPYLSDFEGRVTQAGWALI